MMTGTQWAATVAEMPINESAMSCAVEAYRKILSSSATNEDWIEWTDAAEALNECEKIELDERLKKILP